MLAAFAFTQASERRASLDIEHTDLAQSPVTIYSPQGQGPWPLAVVAHGFGGSRQMMEPISTALARAGYKVVAFDFQGHGRNADPMSPDVTRIDGTTRGLVLQTGQVIDAARSLADTTETDLVLVGHSMATDIVIRAAETRPDVSEIIAISMYSDAITADFPERLLILSGARENRLRRVAVEAVQLVDPDAGEADTARTGPVARRAASAPLVGHVGVLYAPATLDEILGWIGAEPATVRDRSGLWTLAGLVALLALAYPLSRLLPRRLPIADAPLGFGPFAVTAVGPALVAAGCVVLARGSALGFAGFGGLALFFGVLGALQLILLRLWGRRLVIPDGPGCALLLVWGPGFALALDQFGAAFLPAGPRIGLTGILALGTVPYLIAEDSLLAGGGAFRRFLARATALMALAAAMFLAGGALALTFTALPVLVLFWLVYGTAGRWIATRRGGGTGPALGLALAWALAASTPLFTG